MILTRIQHSLWRAAGLALMGLTAVGAHAQQVGQVSLLIGAAKVIRADGSRTDLRQGDAVTVGDRIETAANGHVHLRFLDHGAASVRPDSVLEVQSYRYDPDKPSSNEVRLKLHQGVARSISGAATENDKNRFRLNTPLAAIGVRGTDFIVQVLPEHVRATVATGAIVMAPFGAQCRADALGPCGGRAGQLLSADMGRMMLELRSGEVGARIVPAVDAVMASVPQQAEVRKAVQMAAIAAAQADSRSTATDRAAAAVLAIAPVGPTDARVLNTPPSRDSELAWGRWFSFYSGFDNMSIPYWAASEGRHITVGDGNSGLFRKGDPSAAEAVFRNPGVDRVDFRLTRAQASFESGSHMEAAAVEGGTLSLDFLHRRFATALALSSLTGGSAELRLGGAIRSDGTFAVAEDGQRVAGAVSTSLQEAGYLFEKQVGNGVFRGRTLWGRGK
ncbi:FecR family protein [Inhella gelatinilytica]|uniref:FecR domain-containing protein n=1 Tax=Inhella gelatinilytica TaxID=2795030 RepID=A0A931ISJ1_9BURK|nr:FecR domain-containing protein [Inhella gelatinilytica]MBH9551217.1 FecR domain-containing protein [Inhella gelatinilytica]